MDTSNTKRTTDLTKTPKITTLMRSKSLLAILSVLTLITIVTIAPHAFATTITVAMSPGAGRPDQICVAAKNCFSPNQVNVTVGDTVTWQNDDDATHTATSGQPTDNQTGTIWDSGFVESGKTYSFTFQHTGDFPYFCAIHPWMTGEVIVGETSNPIQPQPQPNQNLTQIEREENGCPKSVDQKYCHKVIIIGAGMAGLGAAVDLKTHNYDFIILEKNPQAGGRVDTEYKTINGTTIHFDTHASFISGRDGNPITELANKYQANFITSDETNATNYDDDGKMIKDPQRINELNNYLLFNNSFTSWLKNYTKGITTDESLQIAIGKFNDTLTNETDKKDFTYEISESIGNEYADDPANLSLLNWNKIGYMVGGKNAINSVFPSGFGQIVKGLVNDTGQDNIQYNTMVKSISYDDKGVIVSTNQGPYYGKYVISTIPIIPLKNKQITFLPPLPQNKTDAINRDGEGTLAQTYLYFKNVKNVPFWDNTQWINYVPLFNETGHWTTFENMYLVNGSPVLFAFNYGKFAKDLVNESSGTIAQDAARVLNHIYPGKVSKNDIIVLYQGESPSYSTVPINFTIPGDSILLSSPVPDSNGVDRVFFAGEGTTYRYPQTTHGAYITGLREANRVMITDTGHYPYPSWQEKNWRYPVENDGKNRWQSYPEYVICKDHLILANKTSDGSLVCITNDTLNKVSNYANKWVKPITLP